MYHALKNLGLALAMTGMLYAIGTLMRPISSLVDAVMSDWKMFGLLLMLGFTYLAFIAVSLLAWHKIKALVKDGNQDTTNN